MKECTVHALQGQVGALGRLIEDDFFSLKVISEESASKNQGKCVAVSANGVILIEQKYTQILVECICWGSSLLFGL